jgi:pyoverdine/dityrosine biosynthesis protein Dit1
MLSMSGPMMWVPGVKSTLGKMDQICSSLIEPESDTVETKLSVDILRRLFAHRRLLPDAGECAKEPCEQCFALHLPKVRRFVMAKEPIHLLLPSFPAKSPNDKKVLGKLPDMAEELALSFLERLHNEISEIYPPGVRITICSDGRAFSDLVGVTDNDVTSYGHEIAHLVDRLGLKSLDLFSMEDVFDTSSHDEARDQLEKHYSMPLETIHDRVQKYDHHRALFNGIQRFLFEDRIVLQSGKSRNQVRNECKDLTYQVIQRSDSWGRLITECFPMALRLSIHPQGPHSEKIGILLGEADDNWLTPWHAVAVKQGTGFKLMHRSEAEQMGGRVVESGGRPSYYEISE